MFGQNAVIIYPDMVRHTGFTIWIKRPWPPTQGANGSTLAYVVLVSALMADYNVYFGPVWNKGLHSGTRFRVIWPRVHNQVVAGTGFGNCSPIMVSNPATEFITGKKNSFWQKTTQMRANRGTRTQSLILLWRWDHLGRRKKSKRPAFGMLSE